MCIIGKRIAELRQQNNLSQEKLADLLSTGRSTIIRYETGKTLPNSDVIIKLCSLFHVSADYLLGIINPDSSSPIISSGAQYATKHNNSNTDNRIPLSPDAQKEIQEYIDRTVEEAIKRHLNQ